MSLAIAYILLCVALILRPSTAGFIFTAIAIIFQIFCDGFSGMYYYPAASLADLLVIILCAPAGHNPPEKAIMYISFLSLINNLAGWILFVSHATPTVYNVVSLIIYGMAFFAILLTGGKNGLAGSLIHRTGSGRNSASWRRNHHQENPK